MMPSLLSLLLTLQLMLAMPAVSPRSACPVNPGAERVLWGLIDPELSARFALLPAQIGADTDFPVLWDWSLKGFLSALFGDFFPKEAVPHGAHV